MEYLNEVDVGGSCSARYEAGRCSFSVNDVPVIFSIDTILPPLASVVLLGNGENTWILIVMLAGRNLPSAINIMSEYRGIEMGWAGGATREFVRTSHSGISAQSAPMRLSYRPSLSEMSVLFSPNSNIVMTGTGIVPQNSHLFCSAAILRHSAGSSRVAGEGAYKIASIAVPTATIATRKYRRFNRLCLQISILLLSLWLLYLETLENAKVFKSCSYLHA